MKFSAANLKNVDYKKLLLNHGEKFAVGVVALLVLLVLWRTNWSRYQGTPEQMIESAEKAEQTLQQSRWSPELNKYVLWTDSVESALPADVKQQVDAAQAQLLKQVTDPQELSKLAAEAPKENLLASVDQMFGGVGVSRYIYSTTFMKSLYQRTEPIRLPEQWETVRSLRAVQGHFLLPTVNTSTLAGEALAAVDGQLPEAAKEEDENLSEAERLLKKRLGLSSDRVPMGAEGMMPAGPGAGHAEAPSSAGQGGNRGSRGARAGGSRGGNRGSNGPPDGAPSSAGMMMGDAAMSGYMAYVEGGYSGSGATGRGVRFVCVTGVYPFREEFERLNQLMNEPGLPPYELLQLTNFELQRQTAQPGPNPWSDRDADWETVDIQSSVDVLLKEAADFMPDIVPPNYRDVVITSPLPARGLGDWIPEDVSHPEIKALSDKKERAWELAMADYLAAEKDALAKQAGGFSRIQSDIGGASRSMMADMGQEQFITGMARSMYGGGGGGSREMQEMQTTLQGSDMLNMTTDMLLFRYFDFAVDPGKTYRYRVRLTVRNPAYRLTNVQTAEVAEGETRTTPWSEPTKPVTVQRDAHYFLADAEPPRGRGTTATALMDVYQWFADLGTTTKPNAPIKVEPGQFIGNTAKAWVLKPLAPSFEEEEQKFTTSDMLVDVFAAPRSLDRSNHPDLHLASDRRAALPVSDKVAVIDEFGQLVLVDNASARKQREFQELVLKYQNEGFEGIKGQLAAAEEEGTTGGSIEEALMMSGDPMGAGGDSSRRGKKPKKTSLKQRQQSGYAGP